MRSFGRFVILSVVLFGLVYNPNETCSLNLVDHGRGYLGILLSCMIAELAIIWLSMRGSILYTEPRDSMQYVLYVRLGKSWSLCVLSPGASSPCLTQLLQHSCQDVPCIPRDPWAVPWQATSQIASFSSHGICSPSVSLSPPPYVEA